MTIALSSLIGRINEKRLSLGDVEADIIGRNPLCYPIGTFSSRSCQRTLTISALAIISCDNHSYDNSSRSYIFTSPLMLLTTTDWLE
jgi:hypothetical protein